jgi:hypothetical protein
MSEIEAVWRNSTTLRAEIDPWASDEIEHLLELSHLSQICSSILWSDDQLITDEICESITLSDHARKILAEVPDLQNFPGKTATLAFFISFYHLDIFIDINKSSATEIADVLSKHLSSGRIKIASRFGRRLYDKYNKDFNLPRADHLSVESTALLLRDTEQGVYQYGYNITGPLGILQSQEARRVRGSRKVPLWHCDNIGCNHLHEVALSDYSVPLRRAVSLIESHAENTMGPPSHWGAVMAVMKDDLLDDRYGDLFIFLQEQFSRGEKSLILLGLLGRETCKASIWDLIKFHFNKQEYSKPPADFVGTLSDEHLSQIIFSCSNEDIIATIDGLINKGDIAIPSTEVRLARTRLSESEATCAVSSLGIRSSEANPIVRMATAIWFAYDDADSLTELSWRALKAAGPATPGMVLQYLNSRSPREAVNELILCSSDITQFIKDILIIELHDDEDAAHLCDRLLWKFGFDVPRYGKEYQNLVRNLDIFRDELSQQSHPFSELTREKIRSSGVNLFVHLENFLEIMISYNVWLFSKDHFEGKFIYEPKEAIAAVGSVIAVSDDILWNSSGSNTLGVLLSYLAASVKWLESLFAQNQEMVSRPPSHYPHYSSEDDNLFPFHNMPFWANCDQSELRNYVSGYSEVASAFLRSELALVRNGLDHYRAPDKFPSLEKMMICEMQLRQAAFSADAKSFFPKTWWMQTRLYNLNGQYEEMFMDQSRRELRLSYPTVLKGIREVTFGIPTIIPHGNLLGQANSSVIFSIKEQSEASLMWSDYPYRRPDAQLFEQNEPSTEVAVLVNKASK